MKKSVKIVAIVLTLITLACMFLPIATFKDNSAGEMLADIEKQQGKVDTAQAKLQRWIDEGKKSEADIEKQRGQVAKEQGKLDELLAKQAAMSSSEAGGLSYSLLPGKLPEDIKLDITVVNDGGKIYPTELNVYYILLWVAAGMLVFSIVCFILAGNKLVCKLYTFAGFAQLIAFILLAYSVLRLSNYPVKSPYSNAVLNMPVVAAMLISALAAFAVHVTVIRNTKRSMIYVFCIFLSALALFPFWIMIVNATRSSQAIQQGVSLIPGDFLSHNWDVIQKTKNFDVLMGMRNSAIIAFGSTIVSVYFSALTAYGFEVYNFKAKKVLWAVVMAIIMIPGQVTGTGFYMFMYRLGLTNNFLPLIIPSVASAATVFFFRQYLQANFQISLVEASRIDGAGEFFTFNFIILPIMVPAMATMGIMGMIGAWNNYLTPLMLLTKVELKTLPMLVNNLRGDIYRTEYGSIYLGLTLTALPLMIVYFALSKFIIAGVALGGVKE